MSNQQFLYLDETNIGDSHRSLMSARRRSSAQPWQCRNHVCGQGPAGDAPEGLKIQSYSKVTIHLYPMIVT